MDKCINQIFRPQISVIQQGQGDCQKCITHPDNRLCSGYRPMQVTIHIFSVTEGLSEASNADGFSDNSGE